MYAFNGRGSEKSGSSAKTTKLTRLRNGLLIPKMLSPLVHKEKATGRKKLWIFKSLSFAGGEGGGLGRRTDEARLAKG